MTVCKIVTELGSAVTTCMSCIKTCDVEDPTVARKTWKTVDGGRKTVQFTIETEKRGELTNGGLVISKFATQEDGLLTTSDVLETRAELVLLVDKPRVPDGAMLRAMYPKSPAEVLPQYSSGNPGQGSLHDHVEVTSTGA